MMAWARMEEQKSVIKEMLKWQPREKEEEANHRL